MSSAWNRWLFVVAGVYDLIIGLAFLFFGKEIYEQAGIPPPNHWSYIQFAALLLIIFGAMFFAVARDYQANRNLIPFGMMLKASYVGLAGYYWAIAGIPLLFKPFVLIDAVMFVLFFMAYRKKAGWW